jgi:hypothetical protein
MATTTVDRDLRSRIEAFLQEISALVRQSALESVRAALGDGAAPARRGPGRPRGSVNRATPSGKGGKRGKGGKGGKRTSEQVDQMAARVLSWVKSNPGHGLEAIGRGLGTPTKVLKLPVSKLMASKSLRTTGQKRGTKYFAGGRGRGRKAKK